MVVDERPREELQHAIDPRVQGELPKYRGKWVVLSPTAILAAKDTATEAYRAAQALGIEVPTIFYVPDGDPGSYYY